MKKSTKNPLDFIIDKLTNSIENTSTGEIFDTAVVRMTLKNLTEIKNLIGDLNGQKKSKTKQKRFIN